MKIAKTYSHLNGLEHLLVRKGKLWAEITSAIKAVDADNSLGEGGVSPARANRILKDLLKAKDWRASRMTRWVGEGGKPALPARDQSTAAQKRELEKAGVKPVRTSFGFGFVKDRVAINVAVNTPSALAQDMLTKYLAYYACGRIDVGIEIVPMHALQHHMSSGPGYYEGELYNVIRNGRGVPSVPLVVIGIAP